MNSKNALIKIIATLLLISLLTHWSDVKKGVVDGWHDVMVKNTAK